MTGSKAAAVTRYALGFAAFLAVTALTGSKVNVRSASAPRTQVDLPAITTSLCPGMEVVSERLVAGSTVEVIMRNGYGKDITAVVARIGTDTTERTDYIGAELEKDQKISPGGTDRFLFDRQPVVIKAVLFADMTFDGDASFLAGLLEVRRGIKVQLARFNRELRKLNKLDGPEFIAGAEKLKKFAVSLPVQGDDASAPESSDVLRGLSHGREWILCQVGKWEAALETDRIHSYFTRDGQKITETHTPEEILRSKSNYAEARFGSYEQRLRTGTSDLGPSLSEAVRPK
jgi:hypothetical protein